MSIVKPCLEITNIFIVVVSIIESSSLLWWLHTDDPDVQESCAEHVRTRSITEATVLHSSLYARLPRKQLPSSTMLCRYSQLMWHPRCPLSSEVHPATIRTLLSRLNSLTSTSLQNSSNYFQHHLNAPLAGWL